MKYIKTLIFSFLIILQLGCKSGKSKTDFLGIWESFERHHTKTVLTFYKDSLIVEGLSGGFHTNSKWTANQSKIYLKNVQLKDTILKKEMTYEYDLNDSKDTLLIKFKSGGKIEYTKMKKVETNPFISEL